MYGVFTVLNFPTGNITAFKFALILPGGLLDVNTPFGLNVPYSTVTEGIFLKLNDPTTVTFFAKSFEAECEIVDELTDAPDPINPAITPNKMKHRNIFIPEPF